MAYVDMNVGLEAKYTETSLWTNPSPTSAFANQTVTLSDSVSNYKYIKFVFRFSTSNAKESSAIYSVDDVVAFSNSDGNFLGSGFAYPTVNVARSIIYKTATSIEFGTCYRSNTSGIYNSNLIPIEILGLNELDHGTVATIPEVRFSSVNTSGRCFGYIYLDLSKYKSMTYTLVISNASFGSGQYIRVDNNGTAVQEMGKTAGTYTINFDDSWTGDNYRLAVIATPSAAYGYIGITNIIFTLKDN